MCIYINLAVNWEGREIWADKFKFIKIHRNILKLNIHKNYYIKYLQLTHQNIKTRYFYQKSKKL